MGSMYKVYVFSLYMYSFRFLMYLYLVAVCMLVVMYWYVCLWVSRGLGYLIPGCKPTGIVD
jgi:hypothetical protein